ncbi:MAG: hypothetical protein O3C20_21940 [Verrucomicrobia bacterium]|nr:hypothetical protein [Verrucomicrobiota bacterium]
MSIKNPHLCGFAAEKQIPISGVLYVPGDLCFAAGGPKNYIRLSFGVLERDDLVTAGRRLAQVIRQFN